MVSICAFPYIAVDVLKYKNKSKTLFFLPSEPWTMAYSKNSNKKFFYNKLTKESTYDMPPKAAAPFR